jgi:hypothetical protein
MFGLFGNLWTGPDGVRRDRPGLLPSTTVDVTALLTGSKDADFSANPLKGLYVGGDGSVYIKRVEDGAWFEYDCTKGAYIYGLIVAVGGAAGHVSTATKLRGEY